MTDLINGRTPEEIKRGLRWIAHDCDYNGEGCSECECVEECHKLVEDDVARDALALIERLEFERDAALAKVPRWISVKERLPEAYQHVIVHVQHTAKWVGDTKREERWHVVEEDCWLGDGWECNADDDIHEVTHWMPMPQPTEED